EPGTILVTGSAIRKQSTRPYVRLVLLAQFRASHAPRKFFLLADGVMGSAPHPQYRSRGRAQRCSSSRQASHGPSHFSGLAVAGGRVYATTHDGSVYAFGLEIPQR